MTFHETKLVLFGADLAGFTRATAHLEALAVAAFLDDWYRQCVDAVARHGGRIVKFMGDGCFATFPPDHCVEAVAGALALDQGIAAVTSIHRIQVDVGARIHLGVVAEGEVGPAGDRRYDVFGSAVNHLFRMGGAGTLLISEPVYRQLPNDHRSAWRKNRPPATYSLAQR